MQFTGNLVIRKSKNFTTSNPRCTRDVRSKGRCLTIQSPLLIIKYALQNSEHPQHPSVFISGGKQVMAKPARFSVDRAAERSAENRAYARTRVPYERFDRSGVKCPPGGWWGTKSRWRNDRSAGRSFLEIGIVRSFDHVARLPATSNWNECRDSARNSNSGT